MTLTCNNKLIDVPGIAVGHKSLGDTGCTVIVVPDSAIAAVDVRGGGPGTRETDLLAPHNTVQRVHAITLTGGAAHGLAAPEGGADRELLRRKVFEEVPVSDLYTTRIPRRTRRVLQKSEGFLVRTRNPQRFIRVRHRRNIDARESREQIPSCGVGCEPVALRSICQGDLRCAVPDNDPETFK